MTARCAVLIAAALLLGTTTSAEARPVRGTTRTSVNRNVNVNRSASVNVQRDVDVDVDRGYYKPAATAAVVGAAAATAAAVGSVVNALPPGCRALVIGGLTYQQCGSAWYQPRYSGTQVTYVVVNPPR
jgi:hypothetical protein